MLIAMHSYDSSGSGDKRKDLERASPLSKTRLTRTERAENCMLLPQGAFLHTSVFLQLGGHTINSETRHLSVGSTENRPAQWLLTEGPPISIQLPLGEGYAGLGRPSTKWKCSSLFKILKNLKIEAAEHSYLGMRPFWPQDLGQLRMFCNCESSPTLGYTLYHFLFYLYVF